MRVGQLIGVPGGQRRGLQLFEQLALAQARVKLKIGPHGKGPAAPACGFQAAQFLLKGGRHARAGQQFAGADAVDPVGQFILRAFGQVHHALGDAQPRQAAAVFTRLVHRQQDGFAFVGQQLGVGQGTGCYHAHHFALHRSFGRGHVAHLLANGHRFTQLDQPGEVSFHGVERHAGHQHRLPGRLAPARQGDVQQSCGFFGVAKKQLVKVAHAVKHQGVWKRRLDAQVLGHHRRVASVVSGAWGGRGVVWHQGLGRLGRGSPGQGGKCGTALILFAAGVMGDMNPMSENFGHLPCLKNHGPCWPWPCFLT